MRREFHVRFCEGPRGKFPRSTLLVILARRVDKSIINWVKKYLESKLKLTINEEKTKVVKITREGGSLEFLGFRTAYHRDQKGGRHKYLHTEPTKGAQKRIKAKLKAATGPRVKKTMTATVKDVNGILTSWQGYFNYGSPSRIFNKINYYVVSRFWRYLKRKSQRRCKPFRARETTHTGLRRYGLKFLGSDPKLRLQRSLRNRRVR